MKNERGGSRRERGDRTSLERHEDGHRGDEEMPDPATCPKCRAAYIEGRWTWSEAPADAPRHKCPACRRIEDDFPAGYVTLNGEFMTAHRDEILNLVREMRARSEHPLQRIIAVRESPGDILVTTTDTHLARRIAQSLHEAYKGEVELSYSKDENLVRATWFR